MKYPQAVWPYSPFFRAWNLLFCSWQIGLNPESMKIVEGGVLEETKQIIKNILGVLEENNLTLANVVKTTIFITDIRDFAEVNKIYGEFFTHKPARTTVEVSALPLWAKIEIEVVASF